MEQLLKYETMISESGEIVQFIFHFNKHSVPNFSALCENNYIIVRWGKWLNCLTLQDFSLFARDIPVNEISLNTS